MLSELFTLIVPIMHFPRSFIYFHSCIERIKSSVRATGPLTVRSAVTELLIGRKWKSMHRFLYLLSEWKNLPNGFVSAEIKLIEAVSMIKSCESITVFELFRIILFYCQRSQSQNLCSVSFVISQEHLFEIIYTYCYNFHGECYENYKRLRKSRVYNKK